MTGNCLENQIVSFIGEINKGPLRVLNDGNSAGDPNGFFARYSENDSEHEIQGIFICAVNQAWLDTCRTVPDAKKKKECLNSARKMIASQLQGFFQSTRKSEEAFDKWFMELCKAIPENAELTVGHKQKIINMAFKYLYCVNSFRRRYEAYFTHCHMPLDGYTLSWYHALDSSHKTGEKYDKTAWSKINSLDAYFKIVRDVREYVEKNSKETKTVLQTEFLVWQIEKKRNDLKEKMKKVCSLINDQEMPESLRTELKYYLSQLKDQLASLHHPL